MRFTSEAPQIVRVIGACRLLDAAGAEHSYWRKDGCGLAHGWYIVGWPPGAAPGRFEVYAQFRGPFGKREEAEAALPVLCLGRAGKPSPQ